MTSGRLGCLIAARLWMDGFLITPRMNAPVRSIASEIDLRIDYGDVLCIPDEDEPALEDEVTRRVRDLALKLSEEEIRAKLEATKPNGWLPGPPTETGYHLLSRHGEVWVDYISCPELWACAYHMKIQVPPMPQRPGGISLEL